MLLISYSFSDVGKKRNHNEDSFFAEDDLGLYIVADGVGGQAKGEVASKEAVENLQCWIMRHKNLLDEFKETRDKNFKFQIRRMLESGIQSSCYVVYGLSRQLSPISRMATTMSVALFIENTLFTGQVGDSRIYRFRAGETTQLTEDHTLLNYKLKKGLISLKEAKTTRKGRNVITRAVGQQDFVEVDTASFEIQTGDRYLLCSDGLHGYIRNNEEISEIISGDLPSVPGKFIELANNRGGKDNITAIVLELM
ncbi:MAG: PP2C family protein-serine/threonine phosphatase [Myxococcota bacterium]